MKNANILSLMVMIMLAAAAYPQGRGVGIRPTVSKKRVALVIGNGAYPTSPLKNPANDAHAMAQSLRELGFDVVYEQDLSQNDMKRAIRAFGVKAKGSSVRLFYYAGHGMQVNGENYLIPVDATFNNEQEVEYEAVNAGFVLAQLDEAPNSLNIVILDACRNNPFARSFRSATQGLAAINAPSGTLIAYATAPGSVASDGTAGNGLYTQELLRNMRTLGVGVEEVFKRVRIGVREKSQGKQTPWESSSLTGDFYFTGTGKIEANIQLSTSNSSKTNSAINSLADIPIESKNASQIAQANFLIDKKEYDEAIRVATEAIRIEPTADAFLMRGSAYYWKKDYERAIGDVTEAIRINPRFTEAYRTRCTLYYWQSKLDQSVQDCTEAIRLDPQDLSAYLQRGGVYHAMRGYDKAIMDFNQIIRLSPGFMRAYVNRGSAYFKKNDYNKALEDYAEAIRLEPNNPLPYSVRAQVYEFLGDKNRAEADRQKVRELSRQ